MKDLLSQCFKVSCVFSYLDIWKGKIRACITCQTLLKQILSVSLFVLFDHHFQCNYSVHWDRCTYSTFLCSPHDGYHKRLQPFTEFNSFYCFHTYEREKKQKPSLVCPSCLQASGACITTLKGAAFGKIGKRRS